MQLNVLSVYKTIREYLNTALQSLLTTHSKQLNHIQDIIFDTYSDDGLTQASETKNIGSINFQRIATQKLDPDHKKSQLNTSHTQEDHNILGTIVAADLISWMGNDIWIGSRVTDEGVKAGSSLVPAQIACSIAPKRYQYDSFHYHMDTATFQENRPDPKFNSWGQIADTLSRVSQQYAACSKILDPISANPQHFINNQKLTAYIEALEVTDRLAKIWSVLIRVFKTFITLGFYQFSPLARHNKLELAKKLKATRDNAPNSQYLDVFTIKNLSASEVQTLHNGRLWNVLDLEPQQNSMAVGAPACAECSKLTAAKQGQKK